MRKSEASRRMFSDNVWEITYQDGTMGLEGIPSKDPEPLLPMDIPTPPVTRIKEDKPMIIKEDKPMIKKDNSAIGASEVKMSLKIGIDISKSDAIDLINLNDNMDDSEKESIIKDIENDEIDTFEIGG